MTTTLLLLLLVALAMACWLATLKISLDEASHSRIERQILSGKDDDSVDLGWLFDHQDAIGGSVGLLLAFFRVSVLIILCLFEGGGSVSIESLAIAGVLSVALLWLFSSALSGAIARNLGDGVVVASLAPLRLISIIFRPVGWISKVIDEAIRRLSGANLREDEAEEDLLRSVEDSQREGGLDPVAAEMIENVVEFSSTDVGTVMTPRTDIDGIELSNDLSSIRSFIADAGHSRIPVYGENLDDILGILYVKDLVPYLGTDAEGFDLKSLLRRPIRIPETKPVGDLLQDFQQSEVHMAIVIDEYGGTAGLVTIEDVLEEIVGEIQDEHDPDDEEPPEITKVGDAAWEMDGRLHIDDLNEELQMELPEDEDYDTIAGYILAKLGRVPEIGDSFDTSGHRFRVLAAAPTHIERVGVELISEEKHPQG